MSLYFALLASLLAILYRPAKLISGYTEKQWMTGPDGRSFSSSCPSISHLRSSRLVTCLVPAMPCHHISAQTQNDLLFCSDPDADILSGVLNMSPNLSSLSNSVSIHHMVFWCSLISLLCNQYRTRESILLAFISMQMSSRSAKKAYKMFSIQLSLHFPTPSACNLTLSLSLWNYLCQKISYRSHFTLRTEVLSTQLPSNVIDGTANLVYRCLTRSKAVHSFRKYYSFTYLLYILTDCKVGEHSVSRGFTELGFWEHSGL